MFAVPVARHGTLVGYLWASVRDDAAGFIGSHRGAHAVGVDSAALTAHWEDQLRTSALAELAPIATLHHLASAPEHPTYGGVAAPARPQRARTLHHLQNRANPQDDGVFGPL
ncbi:hypothetical protein [Fodinicola feengrottensis]|uniref:Uncharacterized protein n=1 Tax=Fodinicola feengrottensis TaxID=435914 RepID=A0ABN2IG45_9ACTN|nr:hypothetical protein [Fodinicola feengrottensis]